MVEDGAFGPFRLLRPERVGEHVGEREEAGVLRRERAGLQHFRHKRVVAGQTFHGVGSDPVNPTVPGMKNHRFFLREQYRRERGAHRFLEFPFPGFGADPFICRLRGGCEEGGSFFRIERRDVPRHPAPLFKQRAQTETGGDLSAGTASDTVRNGRQREMSVRAGADQIGVLIFFPLEPRVGVSGDAAREDRVQIRFPRIGWNARRGIFRIVRIAARVIETQTAGFGGIGCHYRSPPFP